MVRGKRKPGNFTTTAANLGFEAQLWQAAGAPARLDGRR